MQKRLSGMWTDVIQSWTKLGSYEKIKKAAEDRFKSRFVSRQAIQLQKKTDDDDDDDDDDDAAH